MAKIPTVTLTLRKKGAKETEGYIKIAVYVPATGKPKFKSTSYKVDVKYWDQAEQRVKRACPKSDIINREIERELNDIVALLEQDLKNSIPPTEARILELMEPRRAGGEFILFYQDHINYLRSGAKLSEAYCNHFQIEHDAFVKAMGPDVTFKDITTGLLERYEITLSKYASTTKNNKCKRLKEVIDKAISMGLIESRAIAAYKWPKPVDPDTSYLTLEQTEQIASKIYAGEYNDDAELKKVACYFLVECYSGIRWSDWNRFEVEKLVVDRNLKVRAKKNKEPVYLPLNVFKRLGTIIDYIQKHGIIFDMTLGSTNRILKDIGRQVKFKNLRTHIGRHTCGMLLGEMGYNTREIADVLGISEQTAKRYVKSTRQGLNNAFAKYGGL